MASIDVSLNPVERVRPSHPLPAENGPDLWQARIAPLLGKYFLALCVGFIAIACARVVSTYGALSLTVDEPTHLACGLEYLVRHVYRLETQHPPLSRMMIALGPYLTGARPQGTPFGQEGINVIARSANVNRTIFLMRLGTLPFFVLASVVVCAWSCHSFGRPIAVIATALFTLLPGTLADAGMATTDMALGATVGAAFFTGVLWVEKPTWVRSIVFGLCIALAFLSKFTALGYLPAAMGLTLACYLVSQRPGIPCLKRMLVQYATSLALAATTAAIMIWAAYWFSFGPFPTKLAQSGLINVPAPEFFDGIRSALNHNRQGHGAYLLGEFRTTGWWYYFPAALAVKTPIAFLCLSLIGIYVCLRERARTTYLLPLAFALGILLPAMKSRVDIGIRHIEPVYVGLSIIAALGIRQLVRFAKGPIGALAAAALVVWMIASVATHHPDYLAYFNGFAGKAPEKSLVDSNYDWGQDLRLLSARLHQLGVTQFSLLGIDGVNRADYLEAWYGLPTVRVEQLYPPPTIKESSTCAPNPGWNVVSTTYKQSLRFVVFGSNMPTPWYEAISPAERLGPLLLYNIPAEMKMPASVCDGSASQLRAQSR